MIHGQTEHSKKFIDEWRNNKDYICASTSGSTGSPKRIRLLKRDMEISARATCKFFGIGSNSRMLLPLSADYIAGKMMIVRAMISGADLYIAHPSVNVFSVLPEESIYDFAAIVPSQIPSLVQALNKISISTVIVGGGTISDSQSRMLQLSGVKAWATYGMTETCSHIALKRLADCNSCFTAMPGITFDIDSRGCLIVKSADMSFRTLVTNDKVILHSPESFEWLGRYDNVINSGGIKIHPEQDEQLVSALMENQPFYITSRKSEQWGEEPVLMIEGEMDIDETEVLDAMKNILPKYHVPKQIICEPRFERTASGKIIRKRL